MFIFSNKKHVWRQTNSNHKPRLIAIPDTRFSFSSDVLIVVCLHNDISNDSLRHFGWEGHVFVERICIALVIYMSFRFKTKSLENKYIVLKFEQLQKQGVEFDVYMS